MALTGDAFVVDSCNYPSGAPIVSVTGGDFKSDNAYAIASYIGNGVTVPVEKFVASGYFSNEINEKYIVPGYKCITVDDPTEKANHNSLGYKIGVKTSGGNVVVENDNLDDDVPKHYNEVTELQDAIDNITKANQEKLDNNQTVTETVITVTNGTGTGEGINAEIDDTIVIVAKTNEENSVVGLPGYGVEETKNEGKSTYTATALDIGYAKDDVQGSPSGTGKNASEQINTINSGKQGVTISPEVLTSAGTVVDTTDNEYIKQIVADIVTHNDQMRALKLNQATAAKAINNAEKDINNNDVTIKVTTDGTGTDEVEAKTISIFVETYYKTVVTDDKTAQADKSYTLDITPMYQAYASTTSNMADMRKNDGTVTTVAMGEPKELENLSGKNITLKVQLPDGFIDNKNQKVYVIHKTKTYNTTVSEEGDKFYIEFTNPDGFSAFEITLKNPNPTPGPTPSSDPKPRYKVPNTGVEGVTNNHSLLKLSSLSLLAIGTYLVIKKKKDN